MWLFRFNIPQSAKDYIQKSYSAQNIEYEKKENSSISLEEKILKIASKQSHK
jgi:hypothetical protein